MSETLCPDAGEGPFLPQVARGKSGAMKLCVDAYGNLVWSVVRKYLGNHHEAEDVVQETFAALWKSASRFNGSLAAEPTFVGLLARRRSIDWLRRKGRQPELLLMTDDLEEANYYTQTSDQALDGRLVMETLATLGDELYSLFKLHFYDGLSHQEIAGQLQIPLGTVKTRLRQGLIELKRRVTGLNDSGGMNR